MLPSEQSPLVASFLDVGQGDSTVAVLPDGGAVLVDCPAGRSATVLQHLNELGATSLELVVITHSDLDHAGGVIDVVKGFAGPTTALVMLRDRVLRPNKLANRHYNVLLRELIELMRKGVPLREPYAGTVFPLGDAAVTVVHPAQSDTLDSQIRREVNDSSMVLRIEYAGNRILLAADVQRRGWQWMIERNTDLKADVFRMPHHGAWYSGVPSLNDVLRLVDPALAVISVGSTNSYGHPGEQTFEALRSLGGRTRFICTQATAACHSDLEDVAAQVRDVVAREGLSGHSFLKPRSCPCGGSVTVLLSRDGLVVRPSREAHQQIVGLFENPQCQS